ncbi:MAG: F0F1 ATP synthase subunit A [Verrucomicrobiota bacterium]
MTNRFPILAASGSRFLRSAAISLCLLVLSCLTAVAKVPLPVAQAANAPVAHAVAEEGLPQAAPVLFQWPESHPYIMVNSSMVVTWIVAALLIFFARRATKNIKEVPEGTQNFWEWVVEGLYGFLEDIIGHQLVRKTFWFFATVFIFILATNWFGLIPGVGTIGWGEPNAQGAVEHVTYPLLRGGNADLNMTFAMSMIFFACWIVWALQANGPGGFLLHLFGPKGETHGLMKLLMIFVFICVGMLEVVSILFRPISLSFRLFGNVFAGERILETMSHLGGPWFGWLLPIPFYFMELLVGIVQALVFMLLTAVFTLLICQHDEEAHPKHE